MLLPIIGNIIKPLIPNFYGRLVIDKENRRIYLNGLLLTEHTHFIIKPRDPACASVSMGAARLEIEIFEEEASEDHLLQ